jgi:nicotinamidase-related amidase
VPPHFDPEGVKEIRRVPYLELAPQAEHWALHHRIGPAAEDSFRVCLVGVDLQNSFCTPGFELFVGGRSGTGAVDDSGRLCKFIYRNLDVITRICPTMDTHQTMQIFHPLFLIDDQGGHPEPFTLVSEKDVLEGRWKFDPFVANSLGISSDYGQRHLLSYVRKLKKSGKYDLTIWPYHAMLGGIGHALVPSVEEAIFFHGVARYSQPYFEVKGKNALTEHYSVLGPEVLEGPERESIARRDLEFIDMLLRFDAVIIAGQAKSHCVAWTISDLLADIRQKDERLARKVYLLEDCTSSVVIPGIIDYTEQADAAFKRFADAGMHVVRSTDPIDSWPGIGL